MLRKAVPLAVVLVLVACGCEKKKPEEAAPVRVTPQGLRPPTGMAPFRPGVALFISREPLTVAHYLEYLEATDQPIPEQWKAVQPGSADAARPITGLSRTEAGHCATWLMKRLPTPAEWQEAKEVIGEHPYPWTESGEAVSPDAQVFLVQDWTYGSDAEEQARRARNELPKAVLEAHVKEIERLRERLQEDLGPAGAQRWEQLKPAFFALLEQEKSLAELRALRETRAEVLEILNQLALAKVKMGAILTLAEGETAEAQAALQAYERQLSEARAKVQSVRDDLQKAAAAMQSEVVARTKALEDAGNALAAEAARGAQAALAESTAPIQTMEQAASVAKVLRSAVAALDSARAPLSGLPRLEDIQKKATDLDGLIRELSGPDPNVAEIQTVRQKMESVGQTIDREFLQEKLLLRELNELVELRARKKAVEAKLNGLKKAMEAGAAAPSGAG